MTVKTFIKNLLGKEKDQFKNENRLLKDKKGNYSLIISSILLISFLILSIVVLNSVIEDRENNGDAIASDQYQYIIDDYHRNLALIEREALEELSEEVINNKKPCLDSREDLKEIIDNKLLETNEKYYNDYGISIESYLVGIENSSDPFSYNFKTYVSSVKGDFQYENVEANSVNCYNLKDPVPVLYCGKDRSFRIEDDVVCYGDSLSNFLRSEGVENYSRYINASSPFIVKRCPYDPYKHHGDDNGLVMKNCRENYYYHESADGACYLCRLEGKCGCEHYGFETFINPQDTNETDLVSVCGADHVIFSDNPYPGVEVIYNSENGTNEILYLDPHGHKVKYGMSGY